MPRLPSGRVDAARCVARSIAAKGLFPKPSCVAQTSPPDQIKAPCQGSARARTVPVGQIRSDFRATGKATRCDRPGHQTAGPRRPHQRVGSISLHALSGPAPRATALWGAGTTTRSRLVRESSPLSWPHGLHRRRPDGAREAALNRGRRHPSKLPPPETSRTLMPLPFKAP